MSSSISIRQLCILHDVEVVYLNKRMTDEDIIVLIMHDNVNYRAFA